MAKRSYSDPKGQGSASGGPATRRGAQPTHNAKMRGINPTRQPGGGKTSGESNRDSLDPGNRR